MNNEIKRSDLLNKLFEMSAKIGDKPNMPLTAERFVVAAIDLAAGSVRDINNTELYMLQDVIIRELINSEKAKAVLLDYITNKSTATFLDDLYLKKRIQEAEQYVKTKNESELDAVVMLLIILNDPSDAIKSILNSSGNLKNDGMEEEKEKEQEIKGDFKPIEQQKTDEAADTDIKGDMSLLVSEVKRVRTELKKHVFGQDNAINVLANGLFQANLMSKIDKSRRRPRATFLFAGPPGVGKTFLAETVAESLKLPFQRFDMSEYADREAIVEFCGSDNVYKNGKEGNVTGFVAKNPKCVVLFDEIEKAHISIIHLFLQMLDAGRLRDNFTDAEVLFNDAIIILTTNAGKQLYQESESGDLSTVSRKVIIKALQEDVNPETGVPYFPGAICSRFASGNVVMFNHIGAHNLRGIAKNEILRHAESLKEISGMELLIDERVYTALLLSEGSTADARTIRARAEALFNDELYELLRLIDSESVKTEIGSIEKIHVNVDLNKTDDEIRGFFTANETTNVILFANPDVAASCNGRINNFNFIGVQTLDEAVDIVKNKDIGLVLIDMKSNAASDYGTVLNIEDVDSPARDFFKFLKEQGNAIPVYLVEENGATYSEEERDSFVRQGVRGVLNISDIETFTKEIVEIVEGLHQQAAMIQLAKGNRIVSFETAQSISENGKDAEIRLFDFKMIRAIESEDTKSIMSSVSKPDVHFDDVIGADDAKTELKYFVDYLKNPKKYMGTGVKAPKGVLLYGPPGTGKTMLAKAMACEADVTFIAAEGNDFLKKFIGEGSEKVHEIFKTARKYAPSIIFIDEIDAIARERKGGDDAGSRGEATLTAFLAEMDGFVNDPTKPVFVLAATNFEVRPGTDKSLDPAMIRRFDRCVYIDLPDKQARIRFLKMKIKKNPALDISEAQIENMAVRTTGMSLSDLDSVVELALRSAIRGGNMKVTDAVLEESLEIFNNGEAKEWNSSQLERVARHEAGHALLCWLNGETPSYLTIVARGNHGGYMQHGDNEDKLVYTKDDLLSRIRISLGGRAAEIVYYGERDGISTGASGDFASATNTAQHIVCSYGMDEEFGLAVVSPHAAANGAVAAVVRAAVNRILKEQMNEAIRLVSENTDKINSLVNALVLKDHLNGEEIERILTGDN